MRKLILLLLLIALSGCTEMQSEGFIMHLNPGLDTLEINEAFVDSGASATYLGIQIAVKVISSNVDVTKTGTYEIVYEATYASKKLSVTRYVQVVDETPPYLTLGIGVDTLRVGDTWIDGYVEAIDNSLGEVTITILGEVNTSHAGEYIITYVATDESLNQSQIRRYVNVLE